MRQSLGAANPANILSCLERLAVFKKFLSSSAWRRKYFDFCAGSPARFCWKVSSCSARIWRKRFVSAIPFRTAQRWVSLYRQFGLAALARKKRTDTGQHREISAKLREVIEGIALQKPPLTVAMICRQARRLAQDLGAPPPPNHR